MIIVPDGVWGDNTGTTEDSRFSAHRGFRIQTDRIGRFKINRVFFNRGRRERNLAVSFDDFADDPGRDFGFFAEIAGDGVGVIIGDDQDQADPHVEDAEHLGVGDVAEFWSQGKTGGRPRSRAGAGWPSRGQDARRVLDQAAAGDVGDAVNDPLDAIMTGDGLQCSDIDPRGPRNSSATVRPSSSTSESGFSPACSKAIFRARL